ncbi:MFS transporter [Paeniglutamicibacter gangotriensis]|nr:MFS transporter [Paeniglutamicibacter gangotriensis]
MKGPLMAQPIRASEAGPSDLTPTPAIYTADRRGFFIAAVGLALLAAHSGAPSPLFPLYAEQWGLTPLAISTVFAAYILGLITTLLTAGGLSDHIGRRPVAMAALFVAAASMAVLALADGFGDLVAARVLQGVASGLGFGTLGAALLDYSPAWKHARVAMINGALPPASLGLGALLSGVLVEFSSHPFQVPYIVVFIPLLLACAAAAFLKEKHPRRAGMLRSLVPALMIPREVRDRFFTAVGALCASWALVGLYLGIGPNVSKTLLNIASPSLGALAIFALTGTGALTGLLSFRIKSEKVMATGAVALILGVAAIAAAVAMESTWIFFAASIIGGIGFGAGFQGGLRSVLELLPARQRGGTLSSVYLVSYLAFGIPTLVAGLLIPNFGLQNVVYGYAALVVTLSLVALALLIGSRAKRIRLVAAAASSR